MSLKITSCLNDLPVFLTKSERFYSDLVSYSGSDFLGLERFPRLEEFIVDSS